MEADGSVAPLVARVSEVVAARLEEVAAEAGVSYHTLYAWGRGRRNANSEHLRRLAGVVRRRARLLEDLAHELELKAADHSGSRVGALQAGSGPPARHGNGRTARNRSPLVGRARSGAPVSSD